MAKTAETEVTLFNLPTVQKMLPLVHRIVEDFLQREHHLSDLRPEQHKLERQKRQLPWNERKRRYAIQDEISLEEREIEANQEELQDLGVVLLDAELGRVGFPTMVNNRPAFFSWHVGEKGVQSWHFAEETVCRPIPSSWLNELSMSS